MFSKSIYPYIGILIGAFTGGIGGAVAGFFIAAVFHGVFRGLIFSSIRKNKKSNLGRSEIHVNKITEFEEMLYQKMAIEGMGNIHDLYESGGSMKLLSVEEQQAYILELKFMEDSSLEIDDKEQFNEFLHKIKTVHFKDNSILGSYLRNVRMQGSGNQQIFSE